MQINQSFWLKSALVFGGIFASVSSFAKSEEPACPSLLASLHISKFSPGLFASQIGVEEPAAEEPAPGAEHNRNVRSTLGIEIRDRSVGAIDSNLSGQTFKHGVIPGELEVTLVGGVDPEAVESIIVDDIIPSYILTTEDQIAIETLTRRRYFKRVAFDLIQVTELNGKGEVMRVAVVKL